MLIVSLEIVLRANVQKSIRDAVDQIPNNKKQITNS